MAGHVSPRVRLFFADGEHEFVLDRIPLIHELEQRCDASIGAIYKRIRSGDWFINDIYETIRIAAIGAGMKPEDAHKLVTRYVIENTKAGWATSVPTAYAILAGHMVGVQTLQQVDPVGKPSGEGTKTGATGASSSPGSTA